MEAFLNTFIKATGWSIFHSLWQGAIAYLVLFIVMQSFPRLNAKTKHNLAYTSICLIFTGFFITFFHFFQLPDHPANSGSPLTVNYYHYISNLSLSGKAEQYFPMLVTVYTIGVLLQLTLLFSGYAKLITLKKASRFDVPDGWHMTFNTIKAKLNIQKSVGFYLSAQVNVPLVIGYFKPIVLFPFAFATQLDIQHVEAILIHELSHIRRNDYLLNLIKTVIETMLFFNPFVWLCSRLIQIEREHACDDKVLSISGTPLTYAHALLKIELLKEKQIPAFSLAATGEHNQHLYQRIKRITDMKTNYMSAKQKIFAICLTIACASSLAWINPSKVIKKASTVSKDLSSATKEIFLDQFAAVPTKTRTALPQDTTKKTKATKVIIIDSDGQKRTYNSIKELPDSLRKEAIFDLSYADERLKKDSLYSLSYPMSYQLNYNVNSSPELKKLMENVQKQSLRISTQFNSPEWKKQQEEIQKNAEEIRKRFNSPEWKKQIEDIQKQSLTINKQFNSPEWKKQQEDIQKNAEEIRKRFNSPEWKKQMEDIQKQSLAINKQFNSPEWKKQQEDIQKNAEEIKKRFNSPEWKKQMEDIQKQSLAINKQFNSPEWKTQQESLRKNAEELRKQFNSPEWKKHVEEMKELYNSPEYKELQSRYQKEMDQLIKKKAEGSDKKS
ncbi:M56 family metallopeptidase [Pedobacter nutrimenti]|uniref:Beta-lactamase regulating signal transducer with metallopeptidase domain n=1 Tax=Pedobacter nutrimenti TaxID=1241337 RepID=A0A318UDA3_9SPHI|nr:M56 family metallopeptidase [Pedobacter nutrimenti]PYF72629.1 beta-lactamase regulating signal transducer with metallopeptidase domain [Pedobacter nutrimenti]